MERIAVIIVAGGSGRRRGARSPSSSGCWAGCPYWPARSIRSPQHCPEPRSWSYSPNSTSGFWENLKARFDVAEHQIAAGGAERFDSVRYGLQALKSDPDLIAVQDGVRPLGTAEMIRRVVETAIRYGAAIPVVEPVRIRSARWRPDRSRPRIPVRTIVDRSRLRIVQTPQGLPKAWLLRESLRR